MNKDFIISAINPYLNSKQELTYDEFDQLFSAFEKTERYAVLEFLIEQGICLVDTKSIESNSFERNASLSKTYIVKKTDKNDRKASIAKIDHKKICRESNERLVVLFQTTNNQCYIDALVKRNYRFLVKEANKLSKYYNHKFEPEELIQIAVMGFIKGCRRYDISKGYGLLTYTGFWVRHFLTREIMDRGFLVRLPIHTWEKIKKISKLRAKDSEAELEEFLTRNNISEKDYNQAKQLEKAYLGTISLDDKLFSAENVNIIDSIAQNDCGLISHYEAPEDVMDYKLDISFVKNIMNYLSVKERDVLMMRFGFDNKLNKNKTLEEIGNHYGVSRERIRQIEAKALRKLTKIVKLKFKDGKNFISIIENNNEKEFNKDYFFKKDGISYLPQVSEMIVRILDLHPKEKNIKILYEYFNECALQNGHGSGCIGEKEFSKKIYNLKEQKCINL